MESTVNQMKTATNILNLNNTLLNTAEDNSDEQVYLKSRFWDIELLYGRHSNSVHKTYAIRATSKLADNESETFLYMDFFNEQAKTTEIELQTFGELDAQDMENIKNYARYLKINDIYTVVDNLDEALIGSIQTDETMEAYNMVCEYVHNNPEAFSLKSENNYNPDLHEGAWLDTDTYAHKYGTVVLAIKNIKVREIFNITDTSKISAIKQALVGKQLLMHKDVKDIILSTGHEEKCCLFVMSENEKC